ncbi:uncharacterized protein O9250_014369 [Rhynochetos jubatus]
MSHLTRSLLVRFVSCFTLTLGRRVQVRRAPQYLPDVVPERRRTRPTNPAYVLRKTHKPCNVSQRPHGDRVVHLLALKCYEKPELLAGLYRDGISQKDKNSLGMVLQQVATLNPKDDTYALQDGLFQDIQRDWPGYDEADKQALELILSRSQRDWHCLRTSSVSERASRLLREQRQRYEADFAAEFGEYRHLYARMQSVTKKFKQLGAQRKLLSPGSREYQIVEEEISEEYRNLQQVPGDGCPGQSDLTGPWEDTAEASQVERMAAELDKCCPICLDTWEEPTYTIPCLHRFCYPCICHAITDLRGMSSHHLQQRELLAIQPPAASTAAQLLGSDNADATPGCHVSGNT